MCVIRQIIFWKSITIIGSLFSPVAVYVTGSFIRPLNVPDVKSVRASRDVLRSALNAIYDRVDRLGAATMAPCSYVVAITRRPAGRPVPERIDGSCCAACDVVGRNLFRRGILLSGSALTTWAIAHRSLYYAQKVAAQLNCTADDPAVFLPCLKQLPVEDLGRLD